MYFDPILRIRIRPVRLLLTYIHIRALVRHYLRN